MKNKPVKKNWSVALHKLILRIWNELLAYYTPLPLDSPSFPQKPTLESQNSTTHSHAFTHDIPKLNYLLKSIFISLQAKWSVWIYSYFSFCLPSISYCLGFSLLVSLRCIFSPCNAIHPSLSLSDSISQSSPLCVSHSPPFSLCLFSLVPCHGQSNPSDFKNHIIQSGPTR